MKNRNVAIEDKDLAESLGWIISETRLASTGSIYIELKRDTEWVVIRVSDHNQVYHKWLTTYSIAPGNLWFDDLPEILTRPYGAVGDIL